MILRSGLNTQYDNREKYWGERRLPDSYETEDQRKERFENFLKRVERDDEEDLKRLVAFFKQTIVYDDSTNQWISFE